MGDVYFNMHDYENAVYCYNQALQCPDGTVNGYVWLGPGQSCTEIDATEKAINALMSAYMLEGEEIFEGDNQKYFQLIKDNIRTNDLFLFGRILNNVRTDRNSGRLRLTGRLRHPYFSVPEFQLKEALAAFDPFPEEMKTFYYEIGFGFKHRLKPERFSILSDLLSLIFPSGSIPV
jgi:tetratricopeptide (TPR) repeat protein